MCTSHTKDYAKGLSAGIGEFKLKMFINEASRFKQENESKYNDLSRQYSKTRTSSHSRIDSISNISQQISSTSSSSSSLSSISSTSLHTSSLYSKINKSSNSSQNTLIQHDDSPLKETNYLTHTIRSNKKPKIPDSNEFNYWFECSSLSSGIITIDLALDKGNPEEQLQFLRMHDLKTKRLFFLWDCYEIYGKKICGCVGGCSFYSVFDYSDRLNELDVDKENFEFFNLNKSITRCNTDFGMSLFSPGKHILESQPIMVNNYDTETYAYNDKLSAGCLDDTGVERRRMNHTNQTQIHVNPSSPDHTTQMKNNNLNRKSSLSLNKTANLKSDGSFLNITNKLNSKARLSMSLSTLSKAPMSSKSSLNSTSEVFLPTDDNYYTADEEDEENEDASSSGKKSKRNSAQSILKSNGSRKKYQE